MDIDPTTYPEAETPQESMEPFANMTFDRERDDDLMSATGSTSSSFLLTGKNKILIINRLVKNEDKFEWKSEIITDIRVMNAYLRQRALIERDNAPRNSSSNLSPVAARPNADEIKKIRKKRTIEQLSRLAKNLKKSRKSIKISVAK